MNRVFKFFSVMILALALVFGPSVAQAGYDHYVIYVYKDTGFSTAAGGYTQLTSGVTYMVMDYSDNTVPTIYSDAGTTEIRNPVIATTYNILDRIDFYVDDTDGYQDIVVVDTSGGYTSLLDNATDNTRTCIIDERPGIMHQNTIWYCMHCSAFDFTSDTGLPTAHDGTVDTGVDLLEGMIVHDANIQMIQHSIGSNIGICVGAGSTAEADIDGFIEPVDVDFSGDRLFKPGSQLFSASVTGSMFYGDFLSCTDVADDNAAFADGTEDASCYWSGPLQPYYVMADSCLVYRVSSDDDTKTAVDSGTSWFDTNSGWGFIHLWVTKSIR